MHHRIRRKPGDLEERIRNVSGRVYLHEYTSDLRQRHDDEPSAGGAGAAADCEA